jgi:hypothetical protein
MCRKPAARAKPKMEKKSATTTYAVMFMVIGGAIFNALAPRWFSRPPGGGINFEQAAWAGVVGAACAVLGAAVGMMMGSSRD